MSSHTGHTNSAGEFHDPYLRSADLLFDHVRVRSGD